MFNPYFLPYTQWSNQMLSRRFPIRRLNGSGIPELRTIAVTTTGNVVTYSLCPWRFKQLCNEGLMLLRISQIPSTGAGSAAFTVSLQTSANPPAGSTGTPLVNGVGAPMTSNEVVNGNYLLIYFNKCDGIFQVVNHIPAAAPAAEVAAETLKASK